MTFAVSIELNATKEIQAAYHWYESKSVGLGTAFLKSVTAATERIGRNPLQFKVERVKYRRLHTSKFPYALHFTVMDAEVKILACLHVRQSPELWPGA
ncbi:MAG: type II toxin-antitoxin system RelE/ParE family toxin [Brachymonas sp.]|nr:type II toxin-antitoxin system RelE/ParE family toxin [Brachymonas sp.]